MTLDTSSSRIGYAGTASAGDIYTAANHAKMPGGWIGYASISADADINDTEADVTGLSIAATVGANRLIKVSASAIIAQDAHIDTSLYLYDGSTKIATAEFKPNTSSGTPLTTLAWFVLVSPTSGSHTYKMRAISTGGGSGQDTTTIKASTSAAWILVEDVGPAPA